MATFPQPFYGGPNQNFAPRQPVNHTPDPNPGYSGGRLETSPRIQSFVNGQFVTVATGPDTLHEMQVTYAQRKSKVDARTGHARSYVYIWGRVNRAQCMGITLRGEDAMLAAAAQLQRGHIVSFSGRASAGVRQNGAPDLFFNANGFFNVKAGDISVPLTAAPVYAQPNQFAPPVYAQPVAPQAYVPTSAPVMPPPALNATPATAAEGPAPTDTAPF